MEDNFRNALIILSGVIIAAIFIHGLWTIRKQKNPYKLKTSKTKVEPITRDFDRSGFDQDGVGQVKILRQTNEPEVVSEKDFEQTITLEEISHLEHSQNDDVYNRFSSEDEIFERQSAYNKSNTETSNIEGINTQATDSQLKQAQAKKVAAEKEKITLEQPMYQQPVTNAKPSMVKDNKASIKKVVPKTASVSEIKRNQIEINFDDGLAIDDEPMPSVHIDEITPSAEKPTSAEKTETTTLDAQVIILSVVMPENHQMSGAALLPSLLTLGMKFGEMNIFHRHQDNAGNGAITFSLANMLNPGSFDLDTMETFATQGVSLFMTLPNAGDPFAAFEQMLLAAKQLAAEFNAQILDDKRNVMTKQTEQHYTSKIREFDRQHRLARVE